MLNKKSLFSIVLLTTIGSLSARVVERHSETECEVTTTVVKPQEHNTRDLFTKPFLEDLYTAEITGKFASSTDSHNYSSLLNKDAKNPFGNYVDQYLSSKVKLDLVGNIVYQEGAEVQVGFRAKSVLGNPRAYSTTTESIKMGESLIGSHSHKIEPRVFFLREAWATIDLTKALGTSRGFQNLKVGLFPFEVGRGIALGENYGVNPASLGFWSDSAVDQYAPGIMLNGALYGDKLEYDLYAGLLTNNSTNLKETASQIYDKLVINESYPTSFARGFASVNYVTAARLKWTPIKNKAYGDKIYFEPYVVYNENREQKVEFAGDASSKLVTLGIAGEFATLGYEFGFEGAINRGHQNVRAWDRNDVILSTHPDTGVFRQVYSKIYDNADLTANTTYLKDETIYRIDGRATSEYNGLPLGGTGKFNANNRFRDAYKNEYKGWMLVADASMLLYKEDLKLAVTAGIASGDVNPNTHKTGTVREYKGFISLQELYFGKRVKSFFVMGPTSSLSRPHSLVDDRDFTSPIEGFSNIKFLGAGLTYKPKNAQRTYVINPNILMFWQDQESIKFGSATELARNKLGVEFNLFGSVELIENVKLVAAGAIFKPLDHYEDLKGTQLTVLKAELSKLASAGVRENLPTLSNNVAFSLSAGIECMF